MANAELPIPLEIPWRLASTTQQLKLGEPDDTSISLFYYQPILESLTTDYPDENLIYLKFVVSCSPIADPAPSFSDLAKSYLEGGAASLAVATGTEAHAGARNLGRYPTLFPRRLPAASEHDPERHCRPRSVRGRV
jgi:hypothetical protein